MSIETLFSSNIIVPIIVAFIGFLIAVTTAVIAKEQKISEFRQKWIDELRNDIANSLRYAFDCMYESSNHITDESIERYNSSFSKFEFHLILIKLRLNPIKDEQFILLINNTLELVSELNHTNIEINFKKVTESTKLFEKHSHAIIKREWEITKKGEKRFILFVTVGEFFGGAFITAFFVLLYLAKFPEYFPGIN
ncbi:hypothetical protein EGC79_11070 [Shewanella vesiculosa]|uniref:hypothetical protein n=1 Tax=Shewanella vesiculosa TaxID=518738 RepID=UPI000F4EC720|nr:hypothetical protein [Shewanella vesiculosa]RPA50625.1 hypothetical protein EGC79_11070 [Shewanella vesiculosa]UJL44373.1 hypothetical protein KDH10_001870 [Shewanella vesiculosa]